ncbi:hypothetical protein AB0C84_08210 [Actinomadura sp. NPDC048955]|uniref:hypothetical protein n=1 Tax=Actinomadura sp. NPDC048955 TaxID=3158228 RepID=UPI0033E9B6BC
MPYFEALLDVEVPEDGRFAEIAAGWLSQAARLAPDSWELLRRQRLPLSDAFYSDSGASIGSPNGRWGSYRVTSRSRPGDIRSRPYSSEAHDQTLGELGGRPLDVTFKVIELDAKGVAVADGAHGLFLHVTSDEDEPGWVQLRAVSLLRGEEGDLRRPDVAARWCGVLLDTARSVDPSFGHLADDGKQGKTALDRALRRGLLSDSVRQGRSLLRGYSWVTVCPGELVERLGGVGRLEDSGAFARVVALPGGGAWLQATDDYGAYDEAAVERVFDVLSLVLPPGMPKRLPFDRRTPRLVWRPAAD